MWPCHKIGQCQPRVVNWTKYDGQESPMLHTKFLHTKFRRNPSSGSGGDFEGYLPYMGMAAILVMWPASCRCPCIWKLTYKIWIKMTLWFMRKASFSLICKWPWAKVKKKHWPSILTFLLYLNWFQVTGCNSSGKSTVFTFSYWKV